MFYSIRNQQIVTDVIRPRQKKTGQGVGNDITTRFDGGRGSHTENKSCPSLPRCRKEPILSLSNRCAAAFKAFAWCGRGGTPPAVDDSWDKSLFALSCSASSSLRSLNFKRPSRYIAKPRSGTSINVPIP